MIWGVFVRQIQTILLSIILMHLFSLPALAEDEDESMPPNTEVEASDAEITDRRMLRTTSSVEGYQPLTVAGQEIAATYLEETLGERHGAILFFHDQDEQLESSGVITPLRHQLLQYGWSTLTLALDEPFEFTILDEPTDADTSDMEEEVPEEKVEETAEILDISAAINQSLEAKEPEPLPPISNSQRITMAIEFLHAKDIKQIVFLGHGTGGEIAIKLLEDRSPPISALVLIGATGISTEQKFETLSIPILDLYGDLETVAIIDAVRDRKLLMKRNGNNLYDDREMLGANHVFYGLQPQLELMVSDWLHKMLIEQDEK